jgi:hypothetical protein
MISPSQRIRLYESGSEPNSSILGFSGTLATELVDVACHLGEYTSRIGATFCPIEAPDKLSHIDAEYFEITPPLNESQIRRIASICLRTVDRGRNSVYFIDNRMKVPSRQFELAGTLVNWL